MTATQPRTDFATPMVRVDDSLYEPVTDLTPFPRVRLTMADWERIEEQQAREQIAEVGAVQPDEIKRDWRPMVRNGTFTEDAVTGKWMQPVMTTLPGGGTYNPPMPTDQLRWELSELKDFKRNAETRILDILRELRPDSDQPLGFEYCERMSIAWAERAQAELKAGRK